MIGRALTGAIAVLAVLAGPAAVCHAATASAPSCSDGNLATADLSGTPVSVTAGAAIVNGARLTNTTTATLSNASFILAVLPPPGTRSGSGAPAMAWRVDGGAWHAFGLSWNAPAGSGADWQSQVQYFGATFAPRVSHTLDLRTEFTTASPSGDYQYDLAYSADPCGMQELGMNFAFSQYAQGWTQPKSAPTTHKPTSVASTPRVARTSAAITPTHTATAAPSPSASPSPTQPSSSTSAATTATAPPSRSTATLTGTQNAAASRSTAGASVIVIALCALALLGVGGTCTARRARRGKHDSVDI